MNFKNTAALLFVFILGSAGTQAQSLFPSTVKIETEINKKTVNAQSLSSFLQVNESTSEIAVRTEVFSITTNNDTIDTLLRKLSSNTVIFLKGNFPIKNLSFVSSNNEEQRDFNGTAQLTINGITKEQKFTCAVFNLKENDNITENTTVYPMNINLFFEFEPEDYGLDKLYKPFVNGVKIEVAKGFINKLTAASPSLFR
ncbi:MAG: YceI family protein [Bacteroidia bacterium]